MNQHVKLSGGRNEFREAILAALLLGLLIVSLI